MPALESDRSSASGDSQYRSLWVAVVLQAKSDIETEPLGSLDFTQAVAFFIGSGQWVQNRAVIGDYLDLHRDDLEKLGRRCINARRAAEGLEPLQPRQPWPNATRARKTVEPVPPQPQPILPPLPQPRSAPARVNRFFPRGIYAPSMSGEQAA